MQTFSWSARALPAALPVSWVSPMLIFFAWIGTLPEFLTVRVMRCVSKVEPTGAGAGSVTVLPSVRVPSGPEMVTFMVPAVMTWVLCTASVKLAPAPAPMVATPRAPTSSTAAMERDRAMRETP
jgi:hypothetical protein